ncbi:MAG: protein kinase [Myxococcota bacterium]
MPEDAPRSQHELETRSLRTTAIGHERLAPSSVLRLSRYVLAEPLGRGGSGIVYSAYDPELKRRVAIKLLKAPRRAEDDSNDNAHDRLLREAQALAQLTHPNVIAVHDMGHYVLDDDQASTGDAKILREGFFIVMELVEGNRLDRWRKRKQRRRSELLDVLVQAGQGLDAAHAVGLVHRDFKPANVLVDTDDRVKVLDFGLAKTPRLGPASNPKPPGLLDQDLTEYGVAVGTPRYMAPEQHEGKIVGPGTDIYAFCVTAYEILCDRVPFVGHTWDELYEAKKALSVERPSRASMPSWLWRALLKGMAVDPALRYASMGELLAIIRRGRSRPRRLAFASMGLGLVTSAALISTSSATSACVDLEPGLTGAWDDDVAERIKAAFDATALPYAQKSYQRVEDELDRWSARWTTQRESYCDAQQSESGAVALGPWLTCLEQQRIRLSGLTRLLATARAQTVEHTVDITAELGEPESCAPRLLAPPAPVERVAEIDALLAECRALLGTHQYERAEPIAAEAVRQAAEQELIDYRAEALLLHARALLNLERFLSAQQRVEEAIDYSERVGNIDRACEAATVLVEVLLRTGELGAAEIIARHTRSRVESGAAGLRVAARLAQITGILRLEQGHHREAAIELERALALHEQRGNSDALDRARAHAKLMVALFKTGQTDEAYRAFDQAREIYETTLGERHPILAPLYIDLTNAQIERDVLERADSSLEVVKTLIADVRDPVVEAKALGLLSHIAYIRSRTPEALSHVEHQLSLLLRWRDPSHPTVLEARARRALVLAAMDRRSESAAELEIVLPLQEQILGRNHPHTLHTMLVLGAQLAELDQDRRARELMRTALARNEAEHGVDSRQAASARLFVVRDLIRTAEYDEAERLVHKSVATYERTSLRAPVVTQALLDKAAIYYERGELTELIEVLTKELEIAEEVFGAEHSRLAKPLYFRGWARAVLGQRVHAREDLTRAITMLQRKPDGVMELHARHALARSWADEDPARARTLIGRARERWSDLLVSADAAPSDPEHVILRRALDAWPEIPTDYIVPYY